MMDWQEDDDRLGLGEDLSWRPSRTKFRPSEDRQRVSAKRNKRSGKRSHRQRTMKDDFWSGHDD